MHLCKIIHCSVISNCKILITTYAHIEYGVNKYIYTLGYHAAVEKNEEGLCELIQSDFKDIID